jgi:hypothetical protein
MRMLTVFLGIALMSCQTAPPAPAQPIRAADEALLDRFEIRTSEWVSLHFFAFHAARALSGEDYGFTTVPLLPEDAELLEDPTIAGAFAPVAELYRPVLGNRLFRGGLFNFARQLGDGPEGIEDAEARAVLEAFMPVYREHFWPRHGAMAREFAGDLEAELARHGEALLLATADELDADWGDAHYLTHVAAYTNWAGAFSNDNVLFMSASDPDIAAHRLEVFVHETAHGRPIGNTIVPAADKALAAHGLENDRFWHYLQFQATGRAAKRVFGEEYVPYVVATGLASRGDTKTWYDALDAVWDRHDTLEARAIAAAGIVAAQD